MLLAQKYSLLYTSESLWDDVHKLANTLWLLYIQKEPGTVEEQFINLL